MGALAFNPVCPYGPKLVTAAGTPQLLFSTAEAPVAAQNVWPTRVSRIRLEALNANTGFIYIGVRGMDKSTMVGVLFTIPPPNSGYTTNYVEMDQLAFGANNYRLQDYWIDADTTAEGVLRTCWVG